MKKLRIIFAVILALLTFLVGASEGNLILCVLGVIIAMLGQILKEVTQN